MLHPREALSLSGDMLNLDGPSAMLMDMEVVVDPFAEPFQFQFELLPVPELAAQSPTSTSAVEGDTSSTGGDDEDGRRAAGRRRSDDNDDDDGGKRGTKRDRKALEIPAEGMQAVLPKHVELELESLEEFDDYVAKLKQHRTLADTEVHAIQQQRKRIRNRLYALQKRAKERTEKTKEVSQVRQLQQENAALRQQVARLQDEVASLRASLYPSRRGGVALFAVLVTFALVLRPDAFMGAAQSYTTGRALFGVSEAGVAWGALLVRALVFGAAALAVYHYGLLGKLRSRLWSQTKRGTQKKNV